MTAQFSDTVTYGGEDFSLAGISGEGLFNPWQHELRPVGACSACWNGYLCFYSVDGGVLSLRKLLIWLADADGKMLVSVDECPSLFGVLPKKLKKEDTFDWCYEPKEALVPFSGGLLLARGFISELYVHMGFHPAWKYREVHELIFEQGRLVSAADKSEEMARIREGARDPLGPGRNEDPVGWIRKCFSREYGR